MKQIKSTVGALMAVVALCACSNDDAKRTEEPTTSPSLRTEEPTTTPSLPEPKMLRSDSLPIQAGRWAVQADGLPGAPLAVFDVPDGLWGGGAHVWTSQGRVGYFNPSGVYEDPCSGSGRVTSTGDTVDRFAEELRAQKLTTTTRPVPVSVDGHDGVYLEMTAPTDFDMQRCRDEALTIWKDGPLFFEPESGEGEFIDRIWILDVDGQRVVLDSAISNVSTDETIELFTNIVTGATFVGSD